MENKIKIPTPLKAAVSVIIFILGVIILVDYASKWMNNVSGFVRGRFVPFQFIIGILMVAHIGFYLIPYVDSKKKALREKIKDEMNKNMRESSLPNEIKEDTAEKKYIKEWNAKTIKVIAMILGIVFGSAFALIMALNIIIRVYLYFFK